jgi:hypothetical protein
MPIRCPSNLRTHTHYKMLGTVLLTCTMQVVPTFIPLPIDLLANQQEIIHQNEHRRLRSNLKFVYTADRSLQSQPAYPCEPVAKPHLWSTISNYNTTGTTTLEQATFVCVRKNAPNTTSKTPATGTSQNSYVCPAADPCWIDGILAIYYPFTGTSLNELRDVLPVSL